MSGHGRPLLCMESSGLRRGARFSRITGATRSAWPDTSPSGAPAGMRACPPGNADTVEDVSLGTGNGPESGSDNMAEVVSPPG